MSLQCRYCAVRILILQVFGEVWLKEMLGCFWAGPRKAANTSTMVVQLWKHS